MNLQRLTSRLQSDPVYNSGFLLLCMSSLLFSASFNMIIPELPAYLTSLVHELRKLVGTKE